MTKFDIPLNSHCIICNRSEVGLTKYSFNEPKQLVNWNSTEVISDNPNALQIVICGTDGNLVARIKRESKSLSPQQIIEKAKLYRTVNPIGE